MESERESSIVDAMDSDKLSVNFVIKETKEQETSQLKGVSMNEIESNIEQCDLPELKSCSECGSFSNYYLSRANCPDKLCFRNK